MVGRFIPRCDSDGLYERKQCHGSIGSCWCVNVETGDPIPGTSKGPGEGKVECIGILTGFEK